MGTAAGPKDNLHGIPRQRLGRNEISWDKRGLCNEWPGWLAQVRSSKDDGNNNESGDDDNANGHDDNDEKSDADDGDDGVHAHIADASATVAVI